MSKIIKLNDILQLDAETMKKTKIRLMVQAAPDNNPLEHYRNNPDIVITKWFGWKQKRKELFKVGAIGIGLMRLSHDNWLLVTVKKITKATGKPNSVAYTGEPVSSLEKYCGRVVVHFHNSDRELVRKANGIIDKMLVAEILSGEYEGDEFPGYENVRLSWKELVRVIGKRDWITALKNQKGVYLIADKSNGKHYVGSAVGGNMLLQRWASYVQSGHGGNKELKKLGKDHIQKNFQYSILENFNKSTSDDYILEREAWWKEALLSKIVDRGGHGYNAN